MIIDFHTHIFPKNVCRERERYFAGEPEFKLLYGHPKARLVGAEELVAAMDEQEVDRAVVFGFPWSGIELTRRNNDAILDAVSRYPARFVGFACIDPLHDDAVFETERCLDSGLSGVGELAFYRTGIDRNCLDRLQPIMDLCRKRNLPVMIHTNEPVGHQYPGKSPNTLAQIYAMVKRFADNRIVLAHWGGGILFYSLLKKEVDTVLKNVWYDTAASPYLYKPDIYRIAKDLVGLDKILFGTDYPLLKPERYFQDMRAAGLDETDIAAVAGGNAEKLLDLP